MKLWSTSFTGRDNPLECYCPNWSAFLIWINTFNTHLFQMKIHHSKSRFKDSKGTHWPILKAHKNWNFVVVIRYWNPHNEGDQEMLIRTVCPCRLHGKLHCSALVNSRLHSKPGTLDLGFMRCKKSAGALYFRPWDSPKWTELKWWPCHSIKTPKRKRICCAGECLSSLHDQERTTKIYC